VKRRLEVRATVNGITIIDDFAHHPTAIAGTLTALRSRYPGSRLWAILEPRSNTLRRNVLQKDLAKSLALADEVVVANVFKSEAIPEAERLDLAAVAAEMLQRPADQLDIVDGNVVTKGRAAGPSVTLAAVARALAPTSKLRGARPPGLAADGWFFCDHMNYPYGVHIAVVRVDRATGGVAVERFLVAYDIGKAVNPMLVEGQIAGGFASGSVVNGHGTAPPFAGEIVRPDERQ